MAAKKVSPQPAGKKKAQPVMPPKLPGKRPGPGSSTAAPPWAASAKKGAAAKRTARKSGGK